VASAPQPAEAQARPNEAARLQDPTRGCTLAVMNSGFTYRERIGPEAAGESVLGYLTRRYRHTAEADWRGRIASGDQYMSWIALDDHVGATRHLLADDSVRGAANLSAPNPATNAEFTHALGDALHRPTVLPTPLLPLKAVYGGELVEHLLVNGQRVLPRVLP